MKDDARNLYTPDQTTLHRHLLGYISYRPLTLILLRVIVSFNPYGFYVSSSVLFHCSIKHDDDDESSYRFSDSVF